MDKKKLQEVKELVDLMDPLLNVKIGEVVGLFQIREGQTEEEGKKKISNWCQAHGVQLLDLIVIPINPTWTIIQEILEKTTQKLEETNVEYLLVPEVTDLVAKAEYTLGRVERSQIPFTHFVQISERVVVILLDNSFPTDSGREKFPPTFCKAKDDYFLVKSGPESPILCFLLTIYEEKGKISTQIIPTGQELHEVLTQIDERHLSAYEKTILGTNGIFFTGDTGALTERMHSLPLFQSERMEYTPKTDKFVYHSRNGRKLMFLNPVSEFQKIRKSGHVYAQANFYIMKPPLITQNDRWKNVNSEISWRQQPNFYAILFFCLLRVVLFEFKGRVSLLTSYYFGGSSDQWRWSTTKRLMIRTNMLLSDQLIVDGMPTSPIPRLWLEKSFLVQSSTSWLFLPFEDLLHMIDEKRDLNGNSFPKLTKLPVIYR
ncbi:MAG: hypothetical protein ACW98G_17975 [Candidatus Hodarchaeales archaeon]|jgi:hypothetical protein